MGHTVTVTGRRAALYGRVSKDIGSRSVDDQLAVGRRWAAQHGVSATEYRDDGIGASRHSKTTERPDWQRLMGDISAGRLDLLWTWEVSRATRDRAVWAALFAACVEHGVLLAEDGKVHDLTDEDDAFNVDMAIALGVREAAKTRKRVLRAVESRAAAGLPHGQIIDGYRIEYLPDGSKKRVLDPDRSPVIREIVGRLLAGESAHAVAKDLNERGVPSSSGHRTDRRPGRGTGRWNATSLARRVSSPTLAGLVVHRGKVVDGVAGQWPPLITVEEHHRIVAMLADPGRHRTRTSPANRWLLSGVARCGVCGGPVRAYQKRYRSGARSSRYRCAGSFCVIRGVADVDEVVRAYLVAFLSRPDVLSELQPGDDESVKDAAAEVARLRAQLADARRKATAGTISLDDFAAFRGAWEPELAAAELAARPTWVPGVVFDVAGSDAAARWDDTPLTGQRAILRALVTVEILPVPAERRGGHNLFDPATVLVQRRRS